MHFAHDILYLIIGLLTGGLLGIVTGFCLFGAWLMGWIGPVPSSIASNDVLARDGRARSKIQGELPFAWSDRYTFDVDNIGNVTYKEIPYAGDGE